MHRYFALDSYSTYQRALGALFLTVVLANSWALVGTPGLLGDEASEGYNVYELLTVDKALVAGERSYIGPLIDFVRVPFVSLLGYTTLAIRLPMLAVTCVAFWLTAARFAKFLNSTTALCMLTAVFLSPVYLLNQRLGWAITLLPFFALLLIVLLYQKNRGPYLPLIAGLVAGLGLSAHLLFLPTLVAIVATWLIAQFKTPRHILTWWPALVGFWAGFGTQYAVLQLWTEDQGDKVNMLANFWQQLHLLPSALPELLSGSAYIASYTAQRLPHTISLSIAGIIICLAVVGLVLPPRRDVAAQWAIGTLIHLAVLLGMIEQYSLRYFVMFSLSIWLLAGKGLGSLLVALLPKRQSLHPFLAFTLVCVLLLFTVTTTLIPFQRSGGSNATFEFANRMLTGAAHVSVAPLLSCLHDAGPVYATDIHIVNRLHYLALENPGFFLVDNNKYARWSVAYREPGRPPGINERCPELTHFRVVERK